MKINKSYYPKGDAMPETWYLVDAAGQTTGRLASRVAMLLRGKHLPTFTPSVNPRVHVVVINAAKAVLSGKKFTDKVYRRHSGWRGGLRETTPRLLEEKTPGEALRLAIDGMIPVSRLGDQLRKNVRVFPGAEHTHQAQNPVTIELTGTSFKAA